MTCKQKPVCGSEFENKIVSHIITQGLNSRSHCSIILYHRRGPYLWSSVQIEDRRFSPGDNRPHLLPGLGVVTIQQETTHHTVTGYLRLGYKKTVKYLHPCYIVCYALKRTETHKAHLQYPSLLSLPPLPSLTGQDGVAGFTHFVQLVTVIL